MRTNALITQIQRDAPEWSVDDVRELINQVQLMVYSNPVSPMRMYDTATGKDPLLTTTATTFEYTINTAAGFDYDAQSVYTVYTDPNDINGTMVEIDVIPSTETSAAKIRFINTDPGASTYYVWAYRKPQEITASTIQLTIPSKYHLTLVKTGVLGLIEESGNGRSIQMDKYEAVYLPKFLTDMNKLGRGKHGSFNVKGQGF